MRQLGAKWNAMFAALVGGIGCAGPVVREAVTEDAITDPQSGLTFDVMQPPNRWEACPSDRMIGVHSGTSCPMAGTSTTGVWIASSLFDAPSVPIELMHYCSYEWQGTTLADPPRTSLLPSDGMISWEGWLKADCNVVGALGTDMADLMWHGLRDAYFTQIQRLSSLPDASGQTRVEVIDSSVTARQSGNPGDGQSEHGRTVALTIDRLACPQGANGPCTAFIANTLALDLERNANGRIVLRPNQGGYFGSQAGVAAAIFKAVDRWKALAPNTRLVMNLSWGWEGSYGGAINGSYTSLDPPVRAVYSALVYAACEGALIIAAAGNDTAGPMQSSGPMYPAAWEQTPAPSNAMCSQFSLTGMGPPPAATYAPLLFSIGGVDGADQALVNTRPAGRARLAAPAAFVVVGDQHSTSGYSENLTGSSMAAAGASATAAIVWAHRPDFDRFRVMDLVYGSAIDLAVAADYKLGTQAQMIRRVSICRAVEMVCQTAGSNCSSPPDCPDAPAYRDATPAAVSLNGLQLTASVSAANLVNARAVGFPCNGTIEGAAAPANPCVRKQYFDTGLVPWVGPQPETPPCNVCSMQGTTLTIALDRNVNGMLTAPTLWLTLYNGNVAKIDLSGSVTHLSAGETTKVSDLRYDSHDVSKGSMDFLIDGHASMSSQVLIW